MYDPAKRAQDSSFNENMDLKNILKIKPLWNLFFFGVTRSCLLEGANLAPPP